MTGVGFLFVGDRFADVRIVLAGGVIADGVGAVVEVVDHAALVERDPHVVAALVAVAGDPVGADGFKRFGGLEQVGVRCHVEQALHKADRPELAHIDVGMVHEYGVIAVDPRDDLGVATTAQDGRGAGVGIDAREVGGRSAGRRGPSSPRSALPRRKEPALRVLELPTPSPSDECAELERVSTSANHFAVVALGIRWSGGSRSRRCRQGGRWWRSNGRTWQLCGRRRFQRESEAQRRLVV